VDAFAFSSFSDSVTIRWKAWVGLSLGGVHLLPETESRLQWGDRVAGRAWWLTGFSLFDYFFCGDSQVEIVASSVSLVSPVSLALRNVAEPVHQQKPEVHERSGVLVHWLSLLVQSEQLFGSCSAAVKCCVSTRRATRVAVDDTMCLRSGLCLDRASPVGTVKSYVMLLLV
jgi:hypothetical protein